MTGGKSTTCDKILSNVNFWYHLNNSFFFVIYLPTQNYRPQMKTLAFLLLTLAIGYTVNAQVVIPVITNCAVYNQTNSPASCPSGYQLHDNKCYVNCPVGSIRKSTCTCERTEVFTEISATVYPQIAGTCVHSPSNPFKWFGQCLEECSRGYRVDFSHCVVVTVDSNCEINGIWQPPSCPTDSDLWGSNCYKAKCAVGRKRSGPCSCSLE
jgi:hypothetical protein